MERLRLIEVPLRSVEHYINDVGCLRYSEIEYNSHSSSVVEPSEIGFYLEKSKHRIAGYTELNGKKFIAIENIQSIPLQVEEYLRQLQNIIDNSEPTTDFHKGYNRGLEIVVRDLKNMKAQGLEEAAVKSAAKEYADANCDNKWNKAAELEYAFIAGAQYASQFQPAQGKGEIAYKEVIDKISFYLDNSGLFVSDKLNSIRSIIQGLSEPPTTPTH